MHLRPQLWLLATALSAGAAAQELHPIAPLLHLDSARQLEADPTLRCDPHTLLVRFSPESSAAERDALARLVGAGRVRAFEHVPGLELVHVRAALGVEAACSALAPHVLYAEPNWVQRADNTPNDPYYSLQWGVHNTGQSIRGVTGVADADIDGPEAWAVRSGAPDMLVAILDSGTQWSHPDLAANIWTNPGEIAGNGIDDDGNGYVDDVRGWDFYSNDNNPDDTDGHGTHTAGTVGAVGNNGTGVAGVAWSCKLVPLRFLGPQGGYTSDAIAAVNYCTTNGIKVSNNSWGGGGYSQALYDAINASKSIGHVFCAAAGNSGVNNDSSAHYPSSYNLDNIISVAATDNRNGLASFSNYGASSVDLGAPGVDIASTYTGSSYVWLSGTSMATPHVSGVVVLLYAQNPGWSYSQVVSRILATARPIASLAGRCVTGGLLNAFDALDQGGGGGDITPPANPAGLSATGGDGTVALDWSDNAEADLAGYDVLRATVSGGPYAAIATGLAASAFTDSGVTNGTTYYYVVRAFDTSGNVSGNSNQASATPTAPGGPTTLFSDGFESGAFSSAWTRSSTGVTVTSGARRTGSFGARISRTNDLVLSVSTAGSSAITIEYDRRTSGLDNGESLTVEFRTSPSGAWIPLESFRTSGWTRRSYFRSDAASSSFQLRFRVSASANNERADLDNVLILGS